MNCCDTFNGKQREYPWMIFLTTFQSHWWKEEMSKQAYRALSTEGGKWSLVSSLVELLQQSAPAATGNCPKNLLLSCQMENSQAAAVHWVFLISIIQSTKAKWSLSTEGCMFSGVKSSSALGNSYKSRVIPSVADLMVKTLDCYTGDLCSVPISAPLPEWPVASHVTSLCRVSLWQTDNILNELHWMKCSIFGVDGITNANVFVLLRWYGTSLAGRSD